MKLMKHACFVYETYIGFCFADAAYHTVYVATPMYVYRCLMLHSNHPVIKNTTHEIATKSLYTYSHGIKIQTTTLM